MLITFLGSARGLLSVAVAVGFSWLAVAGGGDLVLTCSTLGVDTYADGTVVEDGECYALVHTVDGASFQGFTADGKALDPEKSYLALVGGLAKGGRCPPTLFQVLEANASSCTNGVWELFLLDTRSADGKPTGVDGEGRLRRVNAWRHVQGRIRAKKSLAANSARAFEDVVGDSASKLPDWGVSAVPHGTPQPLITGIRVANDAVELTVADTVSYLTYDVEGAETLDDLCCNSRRMARRPQDGCGNGEIKLEVNLSAKSGSGHARFFKVVRK